jgi:hypothetical protein
MCDDGQTEKIARNSTHRGQTEKIAQNNARRGQTEKIAQNNTRRCQTEKIARNRFSDYILPCTDGGPAHRARTRNTHAGVFCERVL